MAKTKPSNPKPSPRRRRPALIENNPLEDVVVGGARLGLALGSILDRFCLQYGITILQLSVLRILYVRDPDTQGMPTGTFAAQMMTLSPDVPRLIDRLVKSELLERAHSPTDRRVVLVKLTQKGVDLVEDIIPALVEHNRKLLGEMPRADLSELAHLLQRALAIVMANRPVSDEAQRTS
jgi:DNA-binding MarR family transcriptional regulator